MSTDPNTSNKPEDQPAQSAESVLPPDIFYGQMLVLDMFANGLSLFGSLGEQRNVETPLVHKLVDKEIDKINNLAKVKRSATQNFIEKITPLEIAQLTPKIQFSIVDAATGEIATINLVNPTDINAYASGGYLQGGVVGLKSLDMTLNGDTNPAFGKHYIVEMTFVFDSINTFTAPIPNLPGLTYADVLRTQGRAVSEEQKYYRLTIAHDGDKEIINKYNLNDDSFSTTLNLTPIISTLSIKENLITEVKIKFHSLEETILSDRNLFDFLKLSLESSAKQRKAAFKKAKEVYDEAIKKKNEEKKKALEDSDNSLSTKFQNLRLDELRARKKDVLDRYEGKEPKTENGDNFVDVALLKETESAIKAIEKEIADTKAKISEKFDQEIAKQNEDFQAKKKLAEDRFANARAAQIGKRLNEVIFEPARASAAIKEVSMTIEQIRNYFDDRSFFQKFLDQESTKQARKILGGNTFFPPKDDESENDEKPSPTGDEDAAAKAKQLGELTDKKQSLKNQRDVIENTKKAFLIVDENIDTSEQDKAIADLEKQIAEVDAQITEVNSTIQTTEGDVGDKEDLIKKYSNFNVVRYITFGDLISLIMNSLVLSPPQVGAPKRDQNLFDILKKSRMLMCKLNTPSQSGFVEREIYNLPITIAELELILSKNLYGKSQNTFTVFQLMSDIIMMINRVRQQILSTFPSTSPNGAKFGSYGIKIRTYSLIGSGPYEIMKRHSNKNYSAGFMIDVQRDSDGIGSGISGEYKPVFYFGGPAGGAQIKADVSEISDSNIQKAVFEKNLSKSNNYFIPAIFKNTITLFAAPIFHLGMYYSLKAPTIATNRASSWLYIEGDYTVTRVVHSYSAGGTFTTVVEGLMRGSSNTPDANKEPSVPLGDIFNIPAVLMKNAIAKAKAADEGKGTGI